MRSLLTQEMSKPNGSRSSSPSIIARLMGLDGMPPQSSSSHRELKSVEDQRRRVVTSEKARGKKTCDGSKSLRRESTEEHRFKDVYEVLDAEKGKSSRSLNQRRVNADLTEAEMAFIRQKFMEAKRLSTDEKLRYSKEFNETLEALDTNKDLLLKFAQHPNSLFTKHMPDLQNIAPKSHSSQAPSSKFSSSQTRVDNFKASKMDRQLLGESHRSPQSHSRGVTNPSHLNTRCVPYEDTFDLSKKKLKKRSGMKPTEIVVLKPNLGKPQTNGRTLPSQSSSCDEVREDRRLRCISNRESKSLGSSKAYEDVNFLRHKPRDARETARIVTRQMKASCGNDSFMNFEISRFRGYAGDESSSGSDSSSESKLVSVISRARTEFIRKNQPSSRTSSSSESSASKEAMRRLSERWKLAHKSEQEIESSRRNTLAEMLATSDREGRPARCKEITCKEGLSKRLESNVGKPELPDPIGISSREGWKTTSKKDSTKPRKIIHQDRTCSYTIVLPKKLSTRDGLVMGSSFHHREVFLSNNSTPVTISSQLSFKSSPEINRPSSSKIPYMDDELFKEKFPPIKAQSSLSVHADSDTENGSDSEDAKTTLSMEPPDLSAVTSLTDLEISGRPTEELDHSCIPQSQESTKEGDQPSPVSILQTSLHDEFSSSSECFESLSADLQGLRMQLRLLKSETTTYEEGEILISSDEEADQEESSIVRDEKLTTQELGEDWKSLYLADVLASSRFSDLNPESFFATWHSSESPVDPSSFEELEKKYSALKTSTRLERKLLFDRINTEILEVFQQFTNQPTKVCSKWDISLIQEPLHELVTTKYMKPSRDTKEEFKWPNLENDIEVIGKEIEEMLTDKLIAELVFS